MRWISLILIFTTFICAGQVVQNFSLVNVTDDKSVSLEDFSSSTGVVIIFTSINCPYDDYYFNRIQELAETFKTRIPVLLVNSNPDESVDEMKKKNAQRKLSTPYLVDKDQKALTILNPRKSPECFLLQNTAGKFTIVYKGAIDDNAQTASEVNHFYLKDAIDKLLSKQKIETPDVRPVGCSIRRN
jgi:peroxiredoxin